jgi:hypothetical protein
MLFRRGRYKQSTNLGSIATVNTKYVISASSSLNLRPNKKTMLRMYIVSFSVLLKELVLLLWPKLRKLRLSKSKSALYVLSKE